MRISLVSMQTESTDFAGWKAKLAKWYANGDLLVLFFKAPVDLTEKTVYTVMSEAELPVTQQATYLGVGV